MGTSRRVGMALGDDHTGRAADLGGRQRLLRLDRYGRVRRMTTLEPAGCDLARFRYHDGKMKLSPGIPKREVRRAITIRGFFLCLMLAASATARAMPDSSARTGWVRVVDHSLVDDNSSFPGLGVSYFTALSRNHNDQPRRESNLAFLSQQGFNYTRILSMGGWFAAWDGLDPPPGPAHIKLLFR